jgi:protein gp37
VGPGCKFCYAEVFAERFRGVPGHPFEHGFDLRLVPEKLDQPLRWKRPRKIFVNSMSDLFHEEVPADFIAHVGDIMRRADWHIFQVLTKRDGRMRELLSGELRWMAELQNVAYGVSVEDRRYGLPPIHSLQETPAAIRFLSMEPLLADLGQLDLRGIDWVIVGGESGPHARLRRVDGRARTGRRRARSVAARGLDRRHMTIPQRSPGGASSITVG